jgi:aminoglycoside phosphotransferase (APT) family kinase protein
LLVAIEAGPPRPLHGAPHPPQWLADGDRLGLVDFDRLSVGDPEADVAVYVEGVEDPGAAEAFARGYGPLDARRLAAYRARRRILKALRAATALRPDGDERAARRLRGK